jgi:hypothetical protein
MICHTYVDEHLFCPFISAPVLQSQDTLIWGSQELMSRHRDLLDKIFSETPNNLNVICMKGFQYGKYIAIAIIIPTRVRELASGRYGLNISIGVLVDKSVFTHYVSPISWYLNDLINELNSSFDINLLEGGADRLVELLQNSENHPDIEHKISYVEKKLMQRISILPSKVPTKIPFNLEAAFNFFKRLTLEIVNFSGRKLWRKGCKISRLPEIIACNSRLNVRYLFSTLCFTEFDEYYRNDTEVNKANHQIIYLYSDALPHDLDRFSDTFLQKYEGISFLYFYA